MLQVSRELRNRAHLSDPQRAAVLQAPEDVETQPHSGLTSEIPRPASGLTVPTVNGID